MYLAAKWLGRYQFAERPTTAIVRVSARMRRKPAISSTIGMLPVVLLVVRVIVVDFAARRNAVIHPWRQVRIIARPERPALSREVRVRAKHPVAPLDAHRRRPVVESRRVEIAQDVGRHGEGSSGKIRTFVQHDAGLSTPVAAAAAVPATATDRPGGARLAVRAAQTLVPARAVIAAVASEMGVGAKLPRAGHHDQRPRAVVESGLVEVRKRLVDHDAAAGEPFAFE